MARDTDPGGEKALTCEGVEVSKRETVFEGYFRIDKWHVRHKTHAGGMSDKMTREIFERGHAVAVLPYDPDRDEVVLIEQYRTGAQAARTSPVWIPPTWPEPPSPWLIETVAGIVDPGETAQDVAHRELMEEAGLEASRMEYALSYLVSPGGTSESVALYVARVDATEAGGVHGIDAEHEDIRVFTLPFREALDLCDTGRICNSMTLIALTWLARQKAALIERWGSAP